MKMKIEDLQRAKKKPVKKPISFKISLEHSEFLREHNISPTKLFNSAVEELMEKVNK